MSLSHVSRDFLLQKINTIIKYHLLFFPIYFIAQETNLTNISPLSEKAADTVMRVFTHFLKEMKAITDVLNCLLSPVARNPVPQLLPWSHPELFCKDGNAFLGDGR